MAELERLAREYDEAVREEVHPCGCRVLETETNVLGVSLCGNVHVTKWGGPLDRDWLQLKFDYGEEDDHGALHERVDHWKDFHSEGGEGWPSEGGSR